MSIRVYDFFAGCGGASCGYRAAGLEIAFALDHDRDAIASFTANFPEARVACEDIRSVNTEEIKKLVEADNPNPILFSGCAPCQPFSTQKTLLPRRNRDERVHLLTHFTDLVEVCKPDVVFLENVPGLQKLDKKREPFGSFLSRLTAAGYMFEFQPIRLARYGIPQSRRRLVFVGSRHDKIQLPKETHGPGAPNLSYVSVRNSIGHLPPIQAGEEHGDVPHHRAARLSSLNLERIRATPEGGGNRHWPDHLKLECHKDFSGYTDVYGRMSWDNPASGLTTRCISYSNGRFGHPDQDRAISLREAACLQTFPDTFKFEGSMCSMARQIGNAVPTRLAEIVGHHFIDHLRSVGMLR